MSREVLRFHFRQGRFRANRFQRRCTQISLWSQKKKDRRVNPEDCNVKRNVTKIIEIVLTAVESIAPMAGMGITERVDTFLALLSDRSPLHAEYADLRDLLLHAYDYATWLDYDTGDNTPLTCLPAVLVNW